MSKKEAKNNLIKFLTDDINNPTDDKVNDMIPINFLIPYENHPFKLYEGERFSDIVRSIKEMGILLPIIVRPILNNAPMPQYEILSGHNRVNAAKEAGLTEIPAIIKRNLSDDEARLIVTETNLVQRSFADLSHSERAAALKQHMDAIKSQGKRNDLINEINELLNAGTIKENGSSNLLDEKLWSVEKTGAKYGLSSASVTRYIRISYLNESLQKRIDNDEIGIYAAVSLSCLSHGEQDTLNRFLNETNYKVDMKKAELLREFSEEDKLTPKMIADILSGVPVKKKNRASLPVQSLKIGGKILSKYFKPEQKPEEIQTELIKALEFYRANKNQ